MRTHAIVYTGVPRIRKVKTAPRDPAAQLPPAIELMELWRRHEGDPVASDAIYATLREAILAGILPAGERLGELQLAARFNRSRTPVREAILRLESEHLAQRSARGGYVVGGMSREEILEVYAVREVIDGLAARLAAQGCLPADLDHLTWLNRRMEKAGEQNDYRLMAELNIEFHEGVARASRNGLLLTVHATDPRLGSPLFRYDPVVQGRSVEGVKEHDQLLERTRASRLR